MTVPTPATGTPGSKKKKRSDKGIKPGQVGIIGRDCIQDFGEADFLDMLVFKPANPLFKVSLMGSYSRDVSSQRLHCKCKIAESFLHLLAQLIYSITQVIHPTADLIHSVA